MQTRTDGEIDGAINLLQMMMERLNRGDPHGGQAALVQCVLKWVRGEQNADATSIDEFFESVRAAIEDSGDGNASRTTRR
jgi:hypothetical protein